MLNRIKEVREAANMSQMELAKAIGVTNAAVSQWESGINKPKYEAVMRMAYTLNCRPEDLVPVEFNKNEVSG